MNRWARVGLVLAGAWGLAGGLVAAINSPAPFAHGSWLAAYLTLVGGISAAALVTGPWTLPERVDPAPWPVVLWNAGVVLVPTAVLAGAPALLSAGSLAMLISLGMFASSAGRGHAATLSYRILTLLLTASVIVGSALGDAPPGSWL